MEGVLQGDADEDRKFREDPTEAGSEPHDSAVPKSRPDDNKARNDFHWFASLAFPFNDASA